MPRMRLIITSSCSLFISKYSTKRHLEFVRIFKDKFLPNNNILHHYQQFVFFLLFCQLKGNVKVRVMHSNGLAIFPQESNPKVYIIEEINPLHVKNLNFCLNVRVVESELISFEVTVGEIRFKTLPYKVGLHNFIVPNRITLLSPFLFCSMWDDLGYSF